MRELLTSILALFMLGALGACSSEPVEQAPLAEDVRPDASAATVRPAAGGTEATPGNPLSFTPRADWLEQPPSSSMRAAQYLLPGGPAGARDAELVVYYFGPDQGGSLQANVERWAGQFEQPDGGDSMDSAALSERRVLGMPVHEVALSGTFVAETSPGSGKRVREPGWRLLAAIVESDHGPYYIKLTGPAATVDARAAEFRAFVSELR